MVLSGATGAATAWGEAWSDAHIPSHGADPALAASSASAMGASEIAAVLAAAGPDVLRAVKVSARPRDLPVPALVAVARAVLAQVEATDVV